MQELCLRCVGQLLTMVDVASLGAFSLVRPIRTLQGNHQKIPIDSSSLIIYTNTYVGIQYTNIGVVDYTNYEGKRAGAIL